MMSSRVAVSGDPIDFLSWLMNTLHKALGGTKKADSSESWAVYQYVYYSILQYTTVYYGILQYTTVYYSILQYITVYYSVLQYTTVYYSVLQYITVYYSVLQCTWGKLSCNMWYCRFSVQGVPGRNEDLHEETASYN